ncbi:PHB depolymerase family esterase [Streptomyces chiangmaiensis]|uniref:PHB depolymerase family esterase n=1 Tax=Streptomyces chiangmaiensis TaxID=766497 RepID=A0ABU7FIQ2_9ACTN|nr:PHB depolymerase family esterase [Streptomyces chiangmaiensis]MED7824007.1 PHB depolymerase family esterase [Streptomyces chiangmaiensis]
MKTSQPATSGARILHPTEFFHSGVTAFFALQSDQRFSYCLYVPTAHQQASEPLPLVVVVHGTNRLAERYRTHFRDFAEEQGCIVLAPLFPAGVADPEDLHGYKRLLHQGIRYDAVLLDIVEQIGRRYTVDTTRFLLHGFSGGGQFAHRFAYLHPERLTGLSVGAPGRITRINPEVPWWLGTADVAERFGREIDLDVLRTVPVQMLVGDADTDTWEIAEPGLDVGGDTRIERMKALRDNWEQHGIPVHFELIPGMGHSGSAGLPHVQRFFAGILEPSEAGRTV